MFSSIIPETSLLRLIRTIIDLASNLNITESSLVTPESDETLLSPCPDVGMIDLPSSNLNRVNDMDHVFNKLNIANNPGSKNSENDENPATSYNMNHSKSYNHGPSEKVKIIPILQNWTHHAKIRKYGALAKESSKKHKKIKSQRHTTCEPIKTNLQRSSSNKHYADYNDPGRYVKGGYYLYDPSSSSQNIQAGYDHNGDVHYDGIRGHFSSNAYYGIQNNMRNICMMNQPFIINNINNYHPSVNNSSNTNNYRVNQYSGNYNGFTANMTEINPKSIQSWQKVFFYMSEKRYDIFKLFEYIVFLFKNKAHKKYK
ncbi:unnamed protein product [Gordionus sp. m RMFG-2023]